MKSADEYFMIVFLLITAGSGRSFFWPQKDNTKKAIVCHAALSVVTDMNKDAQ